MKPESYAWLALQQHAASRIRPGFAERTLRAAQDVAPTLASQVLLSLATATVCIVTVFAVHWHLTAAETARNLAGWQQFAAESQALVQF